MIDVGDVLGFALGWIGCLVLSNVVHELRTRASQTRTRSNLNHWVSRW